MPHLATAGLTRHLHKGLGTIKSYGVMTQRAKRAQIAPRPAAQIKDLPGRRRLNVPQQRLDVLADIVILRALAKALGIGLIVP